MATPQQQQLLEVFGFLTDPQPQVRRIALASLLPYTTSDKTERQLFTRDHYIEQIATMCADQELIAHDALSALINLTSSISIAARLAKIEGFITGLVRMIVDEKALLSDLATMLLSNMSKVEHVSMLLLGLRVPFVVRSEDEMTAEPAAEKAEEAADPAPKKVRVEEGVEEEVAALELLLEVFLRGEGKKYNPNANYDFLASVFANVSTIPLGRSFLLSTPSPELEPPLVKLISFTEHPSPIRRGGVASCIKNSAFQKASHSRLVAPTNDAPSDPGSIDLLPQMLLPLCGEGDEEWDIELLDTLPLDLQLLPPDKKREPDSAIRLILVETLVLLATTRQCRESMRSRGVYEVVKRAHLAEKAQKCKEPMVRLVNLLMREEGPDTAIEEVASAEEDTLRPEADTVFVSADGTEAKQEEETMEEEEEEEAAEEPVDDYVPFQREPVEKVESEDEEEMLLEV